MNQRISELMDLHVRSKPELQTFLKNADSAIEKRSLPQLIHITHGVQDVVKGYDWVIDELFKEIDGLNSELVAIRPLVPLYDQEKELKRLKGIEQALQDFCQPNATAQDVFEWLESTTGYHSEQD